MIGSAVRVSVVALVVYALILAIAWVPISEGLFDGDRFLTAMLLGGTVVVLPTAKFDPVGAVRAIVDERVTRVAVAGDAIALPLLEAAEEMGITELPLLESVLSSGMRFSDTTKARLHALGPVVITDILASGATMRMSAPSASCRPPPKAAPCTAAITGTGTSRHTVAMRCGAFEMP